MTAWMMAKIATQNLVHYIFELKNLLSQTLHELNLPLTTIQTNTSMLQKALQDEKSQKRLNRINKAALMLKERYNELDYFLKKQAKQQTKEEFFIDELLQSRVEFFQDIYPSHQFKLTSTHTKLFGDKIGLTKAIDNLIDNAVKYSPKNSTISILFHESKLQIIDRGIGIDEMELLKIFDAYYQADSSKKGFGIGLYLVKSFCDENGIELAIQSKKGVGTAVILNLKGWV